MRTPPFFPLVILFFLTACDSTPPNDAAARRAEAAEARMDAEAARMVAAADSVRAAGEGITDGLRARKVPKSKPPLR